jgi:hypothetical protein
MQDRFHYKTITPTRGRSLNPMPTRRSHFLREMSQTHRNAIARVTDRAGVRTAPANFHCDDPFAAWRLPRYDTQPRMERNFANWPATPLRRKNDGSKLWRADAECRISIVVKTSGDANTKFASRIRNCYANCDAPGVVFDYAESAPTSMKIKCRHCGAACGTPGDLLRRPYSA